MVLDAVPWNECLSQQDVSSSACTQLWAGSSRLGVPLPSWKPWGQTRLSNARAVLEARGTPRWMHFLWTSFHHGKKGKSLFQLEATSWKSPLSYPPLWRRQARALSKESSSGRLLEALLQKKTPFLCKEQGARTQKGMFPAACLERPTELLGGGGGCGRDRG